MIIRKVESANSWVLVFGPRPWTIAMDKTTALILQQLRTPRPHEFKPRGQVLENEPRILLAGTYSRGSSLLSIQHLDRRWLHRAVATATDGLNFRDPASIATC